MAGKNLSDSDEPISDINVTPFVDVVLVLLVIFMVTAPMLVREQLSVTLPKAQSGEKAGEEKSLHISVDEKGKISFQGAVISDESLLSEIKKMTGDQPSLQAIISADTNSKHGDVVRAIDIIKSAGITRFAIQIERKR